VIRRVEGGHVLWRRETSLKIHEGYKSEEDKDAKEGTESKIQELIGGRSRDSRRHSAALRPH